MRGPVGLLTIGQAPRPDGLASDVAAVLGDVPVIERGALDGLSLADVAAMGPKIGDDTLVTLLADGTNVTIAKRAVLALLQNGIDALERHGVTITLLMCTGAFPVFRHRQVLLAPQAALYATVRAFAAEGKVGSLTPLPEQLPMARRKWAELGVENAVVAAADPYGDDPLRAVAAGAARLRDEGASVCFMDCFGYDLGMRDVATSGFGGPVVLARSMAARMAAEVVA
ncbi:MAG: AroM family protein [Trueperaceae bacterium]